MIKVLQVISDTNIGGAGRWLLNFLKEYDKNCFNITVALPKESMLKNEVEDLGIKIIEVPAMAEKSFDIKAVRFFVKFFKNNKYDIIHTHAGLSARVGAKICKSGNIIYSKHCIDNIGIIKKISYYVNNYFCDKIIAVANAAKKSMILNGMPDDKIEVIYNGVEKIKNISEERKINARKKYGVNDNDILISTFARLEEIKGHKFLIRAADILLSTNKNLKFIIVGTGSQEEKLKKQVNDLGIDENVIFTGHLNDVTEVINITDINVVSSYSEALSLSIIESMSIGIPCIATNTGGNPELVHNGINGILVSVANSDSLVKAIKRLVDNKELREKMGYESLIKMEENFTSKKMAEKIEKLYKTIV